MEPYPHVGTCVCVYNYMYTVLQRSISSLPSPSSTPSLPPSFPTPLLCLPPSPSSPLSLLSMPSSLLCVDMYVHLIISRGFLSLSECSPHSTTPTHHHHISPSVLHSFPSPPNPLLISLVIEPLVGLYVVWDIGVICTYLYRMEIPH